MKLTERLLYRITLGDFFRVWIKLFYLEVSENGEGRKTEQREFLKTETKEK